MLIGMTERGPDSAGLAVFTAPAAEPRHKLSLYSGESERRTGRSCSRRIARRFRADARDLAARQPRGADQRGRSGRCSPHWLARNAPTIAVLSVGQSHRSVQGHRRTGGHRRALRLQALRGTHLVGHTRMATESAVTPAHAHPFTAGGTSAWCTTVRCRIRTWCASSSSRSASDFETDNDTEAACRFLEWRMREGDDLDNGDASAASASSTASTRS